jgi:translation initiation factor 1A
LYGEKKSHCVSTKVVFFLSEELQSKVRLPREELGEIFGIVAHMLGANRVEVRSMDGKTRMGRIPGKMKKRVWLREGDVVVIVPWAFQDEKADIVWRYQGTQVEWLKKNGYLY